MAKPNKILTDRLVAGFYALGVLLGYPLNVSSIVRLLGYHLGEGSKFYGRSVSPDMRIGNNARIASGVSIGPRVTIGTEATVWQNTVLARDVKLGDKCTVGTGAHLEAITLGPGSMICSEVICMGHGDGRIAIGEESYVGPRCVLDWSDSLCIGNFVHIAGPSTAFWTHSSVFQALQGDSLSDKSLRTTAPVQIRNNVHIGSNCTIYPGTRIGDHSVILPNTAVNTDIPSWVMAGGVPVRVIRSLSSEDFPDAERKRISGLESESI